MTPENGRWVEALLHQRTPLPDLMHDILRAVERSDMWKDVRPPHPDWEALHALDFMGGFDRLTRWMDELLTETPPPADINGLYFAMIFPSVEATFRELSIFTTGSRRYPHHDWAQDFDWAEDHGIVRSEILTSMFFGIAGPATEIDQRQKALWTCFQYTGLVVAEWTRGPLRRKLLGTAASRFLFVGLDPWMGFNIDLLTPGNTP